MLKLIASPLGAVTILAIVLVLLTACDDDAQSVREANRTPAPPTATAEAPTPSAEIQTTELQGGDCINSTIPAGISIDTVVIVPCSGDWQYRVLNSFQVADASTYPGEESFLDQLDGNCDRQTSFYLHPTADSWELGDRTIMCLQQASDLLISDLLEGTELDTEELSEDQRSCLREWVAGADLIALATAPEDSAVIDDFVAHLWRCVPDLLISPMLRAMGVEMEELSEDERSCLREWVAGADLITLATAPEDPAVIDDFVAHLESCVPDRFDSAASTGTSANTPTPEPTAAPTTTPTDASEVAALAALYEAANGANWKNNDNWLSDKPIGEWHGVTTDRNGRVTELDLSENQLTGSIPSELGSLSNLTVLYLWGNSLSGGIPPELGNLTNLELLHLAENQLTGSIPYELGSLSNLTQLYLWGNSLSGGIPSELGSLSNLTVLYLWGNSLSGGIPSELGSLSNLTVLYLWGNSLSGGIPPELGFQT